MYAFLPDDRRLDLCVSFVMQIELRQLSLDKVIVAWRLATFTNKAALNTNYWSVPICSPGYTYTLKTEVLKYNTLRVLHSI